MVFSPWYLDLCFLGHGISSEVLIPSIESMVLICYGLGPWYCERPKTIKEKGDHLERYNLNELNI